MKRLSIGIDYNQEFTMICYYDTINDNVISVSCIKGENRFIIRPTEEERESENLFGFIGRLFSLVERDTGPFEVEKIALTIENREDKAVIEDLFEVFQKKGISAGQIEIISHNDSFVYYVVNQDKRLWVSDTLLVEFHNTYIVIKRLIIEKNRKPFLVKIKQTKTDITDTDISFDFFLKRIFEEEYHKGRISSIYLTGEVPDKNEITQSLEYICRQSRVFEGKNLYVQGACFSVITRNLVDISEYRILSESRTLIDIALLTTHYGKNSRMLLSKAGMDLREEKAEIICILDDINIINFIITSVTTGNSSNFSINLCEFPTRQNKTTKIKISLMYLDKNNIEIEVKDLGFGDFFKSSGKIIKEKIAVDNYL